MASNQTTTSDVDVDLGRLFASIARDWRRIVVVALGVTLLAFAITFFVTPRYMGETRILIETRESEITRIDRNGDRAAPILDEEGVTSQVEVITSTDILKKVARDLDLASRDEFDAEPSLLGRALILVGLQSDPSALPREERALQAFRQKLEVYRVERSRVIVIEFWSEDRELAAAVPNALADAYVAVQQAAKLQSNADATEWLEPEIADLREKVKAAEARVAEFRGQSDLFVGGDNNSALSTQQLSELSSELSRVRANRSAAEAKAQTVRAALQGGASLDSIPDVLASGLIERLREREVELRSEIADLSTTLLPAHPRIRSLNSQLSDLEGQIRAEAQKVQTSLENEARTAKAREDSLIAEVNRLKAESARAGEESVELRALEREAAAQRELLESYLTRYREATSRADRNYLPADARIFSRATVPAEPYFPKILPIVGAAFVASLLVMAIVTLLRELFSGRAMRPAAYAHLQPVDEVPMPVAVREETVTETRVEPLVPRAEIQPDREAEHPTLADRLRAASPLPAVEPRREQTHEPLRRTIGEVDIERAAESLIAGGATRAIFVSPEGDEGAAASVLVAREIADSGLRTVLLDLTASGAASRPMLESTRYTGITNLLVSEAQFADVIHTDLYSACHVIPVGTANAARAMRAAERLPIILESLTTAYDIVIVECGPANADGIRRLVSDDTAILVSAIEPSEEIAQAASQLARLRKPIIVSPADRLPPPTPGRTAA
jgi:exopolysaccharide transport family protein